jgi:hypothetical protein
MKGLVDLSGRKAEQYYFNGCSLVYSNDLDAFRQEGIAKDNAADTT